MGMVVQRFSGILLRTSQAQPRFPYLARWAPQTAVWSGLGEPQRQGLWQQKWLWELSASSCLTLKIHHAWPLEREQVAVVSEEGET